MPPSTNSGALPESISSRSTSTVEPSGIPRAESGSKAAQNTTERDKDSNQSSNFLHLPIELKLQIAELLPTRDIPSLRMISGGWAAAGAPSLFSNGFKVRPHLDDMDRLSEACEHPEIAKGIRHVDIFAGDMDHAQLATAIRREEQYLMHATGGQLSKVWKIVDAIFEPSRFKKHCNADILDMCFQLLPNLESLRVTSKECPVRGPDAPFCIVWGSMEQYFDEVDDERLHFLDPETSIRRYGSVLSSAVRCKSIRKLEFDSFPIDYFRLYRELLPPAEYTDAINTGLVPGQKISHITALRIIIVGWGLPRPYEAETGRLMAGFLGRFQNLRSLDVSYREEEDESEDGECLNGFEETFYQLRFPHLHSFRISRTGSPETPLGKFLFAHRHTLRNLNIGEMGCYPIQSSWKKVLTHLRKHMALEKFELHIPSVHGGRMYDAHWRIVVGEGRGRITDAKLFELYVLGKCPWPMTDSNPREGGWKKKFSAEDMKLLDLGEDELKDLLADGWETDGDSEADDGDGLMDVDINTDDSVHGSVETSSEDEDRDFIDDGNVAGEDGEWEDMDLDDPE